MNPPPGRSPVPGRAPGTLSLNLSIAGVEDFIEAEALVSSADFTYVTLSGTARGIDENIWAVELSSKNLNCAFPCPLMALSWVSMSIAAS